MDVFVEFSLFTSVCTMIETRRPLVQGKKPGYPGRREMEQVEGSTRPSRHSPQTNKRLLAAVSQRLEKLATSPESPRRRVGSRRQDFPQTRSPSPSLSPRRRLGSDPRGSLSYNRSPSQRQDSDLDLRGSPCHTPGHHSPGRNSDLDLHVSFSPCRSPCHRHGSELERCRHGAHHHRPGPPMLKRIYELRRGSLRRGSLTGSLPDLRDPGNLDYLETLFREAMTGLPVAPVPPLPQGSDAFREAMRDLYPQKDVKENASTILTDKNCSEHATGLSTTCKYTNKHGPCRPRTLPGIATRSTTASPRRLPSPSKSTPASPTRSTVLTPTWSRLHGGLLPPLLLHTGGHRHRHTSNE